MLSGIGPKDHLNKLNIPLIHDLPVGQKLYDHLTFLGLIFTVNQSITLLYDEVVTPNNIFDYIINSRGVLTSLGGGEAIAYLQTNLSKDYVPPDYPDIELLYIGGSIHSDNGLSNRKMFRISDEMYDLIWKPLENKHAFSIYPLLLHPKSYGKILLKSKNPYHWPKLYGNYFTDPNNSDIRTFIAAIREIQKIIQQPSFQKYNTKLLTIPLPKCKKFQFDSDEYWECALRHLSVSLNHQGATCKMGPSDDPEAVVDSNLYVYGVKNLRVADTSIVPITLSAHNNIPAFMIGEKVSDIIKHAWHNSIHG